MTQKEPIKNQKHQCCQNDIFKHGRHHHHSYHHDLAIYGLGIFGALFYFLQDAATFTAVIVGIFKSIFWPAFVVFRVLTDLHI